MRIHSIAVAHLDWSAYWRADGKDGHVFRSACFEHGLSPADFPTLLAVVRDPFLSLRIHPLLPYVLKYFEYALAEEDHPAYLNLVYNCEREWAWSVCNAISTELGVNVRVFVQSAATFDFLGRVTPELQGVPESLKPGFHVCRVDLCCHLGSPSSRGRGCGARPPPVDRLLHWGT